MSDLCVVHLIWKPLGPDALRRFLDAYRRMPAGREHRLVALFNGFDGGDDAEHRALLADVPHEVLRLDEPVQDIAAYAEAARRVECGQLCFLNSYSAPLQPGWLSLLHGHLIRPGVGLVGATGSWESHRTNLEELTSVPALLRAAARRVTRAAGRGAPAGDTMTLARGGRGTLGEARRELARTRERFDVFPNPHIRTNGFMITRELFNSLRVGPVRDKLDALDFESGRESLTAQVRARGLATLVVGRNGHAYLPADWWRAGAWRSGAQENLLIADNRTREFDALPPDDRARMAAVAWGRDPSQTALQLQPR